MLPGLVPLIAASGSVLRPQDVFAASLYAGNGSARSITTGFQPNLLWIKNRTSIDNHRLVDSVRGVTSELKSNSTDAAVTTSGAVTSFDASGFSLGTNGNYNGSGQNYVAWSFCRAPRFFDVMTYTGTSANRTVSHNLGAPPGMIIVKRVDSSSNVGWIVYHRSQSGTPQNDYMRLSDTSGVVSAASIWNNTAPTSTQFTVGTNNDVNAGGELYVAYLFAHDDTAGGLVQCGSYTGNGSTSGPTITLGWRPQWLMFKQTSNAGNDWTIIDAQRSTVNPRQDGLFANNSGVENSGSSFDTDFLSTGFQLRTSDQNTNGSGQNYIYIAIREPI